MRLIYFFIWLAGVFGHRKAKLLYRGQREALQKLKAEYSGRLQGTHPIWIHVASVGEFEQARPIIEHLRSQRPDAHILLTFYSPSGYVLRKNYAQVDYVSYLPIPTYANARQLLDTVEPSIAIFVKYEFWPAYLKNLRKRHIPTYSISAIFRRGQLFFLPWGGHHRQLLHCFTRIYVQDEASKSLLERFGIKDVRIAGDTRFDRVSQVAAQAKELPVVENFVSPRTSLEGLPAPHRVIIAGSTWPEDEELLAHYVDTHPDVLLVLVPHEIHEAHLRRIFHIFHGRYVRFTEADRHNVLHVRTLLIDTIGMLSSIYRYGDVAYIGGGFGAGIHNTLEAAVYGMPVLFGPKYTHFREAIGLIDAGAAYSITDYTTFEARMDEALANHANIGKKAGEFVRQGIGATDYIYKELFKHDK